MDLQPYTSGHQSPNLSQGPRSGSLGITNCPLEFNPAEEVFVVDAIAEEPPFKDLDFSPLPSLRDIHAAQQWLIDGADWQGGAIPVTRVLREFLLYDDRSIEMHQLPLLTVSALDQRRNWESLATLVDGFYATTEQPHEYELQLALVGALAQCRTPENGGLWTPESFRLLCEVSKRQYPLELRLIAIPAIAPHGKWAFPYLGAALADEDPEIQTAAQRALLPHGEIRHTVEPLLVLYGMLDPLRPGISEFRNQLCLIAQYYHQHIPVQAYVKVLLGTTDGPYQEGTRDFAREVVMAILRTGEQRYALKIAEAFSELCQGDAELQAEAAGILKALWRDAGTPRKYQVFDTEHETESCHGLKKREAEQDRNGKKKGRGKGRSRARGRGER